MGHARERNGRKGKEGKGREGKGREGKGREDSGRSSGIRGYRCYRADGTLLSTASYSLAKILSSPSSLKIINSLITPVSEPFFRTYPNKFRNLSCFPPMYQ
jgi:hypothetical protein